MAITPIHQTTSGPRITSVVKTPVAVLVIASVEIALGVLFVGAVLEAHASRFDTSVDYVSVFGYASSAVMLAAVGFVAVALFSAQAVRLRRLLRAHIGLVVAAVGTTVGNLLVMQVSNWTTTFTCDGCGVSASSGPTVNEIVASVALDLGAGALAVLLPAIALLLMRNRREAAQQS